MLTVFARPFILLGEEIQGIRATLIFSEGAAEGSEDALKEAEKAEIREHLGKLIRHCETLNLPVSKQLIENRLNDLPKSEREFGLLIEALYAEIKDKLLVFIPQHRLKILSAARFFKR